MREQTRSDGEINDCGSRLTKTPNKLAMSHPSTSDSFSSETPNIAGRRDNQQQSRFVDQMRGGYERLRKWMKMGNNDAIAPSSLSSSLLTGLVKKELLHRLIEYLGSPESLGNANPINSMQIASDPLRAVFSYLDFNDWRISHQWRVCRWWYYTMRNSASLRLDEFRLPNGSDRGRLFVASSLSHHVTRISITSSDEITLVLSLNRYHTSAGIELLRLRGIPFDYDLSPLLTLTRLHTLITHSDVSLTQLRVIAQLPTLKIFMRRSDVEGTFYYRQQWTRRELVEVTKAPTRCSQWIHIDFSRADPIPTISLLAKFSSLTSLDLDFQIDCDGIITRLDHLECLALMPFGWRSNNERTPIASLVHVKTVLTRCRSLRQLYLSLGLLFEDPIRTLEQEAAIPDIHLAENGEISNPTLADATQQLKDTFTINSNGSTSSSSSSSLEQLHIAYAHTLTDLSFLASISLSQLRVLTLWSCWCLTPSSLIQIAESLTQLEWLEITFALNLAHYQSRTGGHGGHFVLLEAKFKPRYDQLETMRSQLSPPSLLIPSLRTFILRLGADTHQPGPIDPTERVTPDRPYVYHPFS